MPLYSEVMNEGEINKLVGVSPHNILIIGCGWCTNESIAFHDHLPIFQTSTAIDSSKSAVPYAVNTKLTQVARSLESLGHHVYIGFPNDLNCNFLCTPENPVLAPILENISVDIDLILAMCCMAGSGSIRREVGTQIPVIQITRQCGVLSYTSYELDDKSEIMDYAHTKVILFSAEGSKHD